jgi:hypothetical protein
LGILTRRAASAPTLTSAPRNVEILAPTFLEYGAARLMLPHARVRQTGVSLARWQGASEGTSVIVCGLAGALAPDLRPGIVLIPEQVGLADGSMCACDPELVQVLVRAARASGFQADTRPLLTSQSLIVGDARYDWFQRGFVAADMETGLLMERNLRVATIRVVLDTPEYGLSPDWLRPTRALLRPSLWKELFWLSHAAPRYALRAARVVKAGLCLRSGEH